MRESQNLKGDNIDEIKIKNSQNYYAKIYISEEIIPEL